MLFTPLFFTAHAGFVCFAGKPISDLRVIALRNTLFMIGLAEPKHSRAFGIYETAHNQLMAAYADARALRRRAA